MKNLFLSLIALVTLSSVSLAQHQLQTDDGAGHHYILQAPPVGGPAFMQLYTFPSTPGTFLTQSGGTMSINGVAYTWPAGNASGVLTNNGSGGLSWSSPISGGTTNTIPKYTGATTIGASSITDDGTTVSTSENLSLNASNASVSLKGNSTGKTTIQAGNQGATNVTYTLPTSAPSVNGQVLSSTTGGTLSWSNPGASSPVRYAVTGATAGVGTTSITVPDANVTATNPIVFTYEGATNAHYWISARNAGTSFTISGNGNFQIGDFINYIVY